jgi:hypothetical protein
MVFISFHCFSLTELSGDFRGPSTPYRSLQALIFQGHVKKRQETGKALLTFV